MKGDVGISTNLTSPSIYAMLWLAIYLLSSDLDNNPASSDLQMILAKPSSRRSH